MAEVGEEKAIMDYVCKIHGVTPDEVTIKKTGELKYDITITPRLSLEELVMELKY